MSDLGPAASSWVLERERRARRRERAALLATVVSVVLLHVLVLFHLNFGVARLVGVAPQLSVVAGLSLFAHLAIMTAAPEWCLPRIQRLLMTVSAAISAVVVSLALAALFVFALPIGFTAGRRTFVRRHGPAAPWVSAAPWRVTTWVPKHTRPQGAQRFGAAIGVLAYFAGRRRWFLLLVTLVLLLIASILVAAHSTVLSPFIYPLF